MPLRTFMTELPTADAEALRPIFERIESHQLQCLINIGHLPPDIAKVRLSLDFIHSLPVGRT